MAYNYPETIPEAYTAHENLEAAYRHGWNHGHGVACHNVPSIGDTIRKCADHMGLGDTVTADTIADYHLHLCHAAADSSHDFNPYDFEGSAPDEDLWDAFETGVADAIAADLADYTEADYSGE